MLCFDLFCGLGGWTEGFLAEGWRVIGFDIEARPYPAQLVLQDVLTIHGSQFKDADCIVASPPCQNYSYMAMPWKRGKAIAAEIRADTSGERLRMLNALFNACFRIQREASEAAGRYIPMVVENVKGAQPWVGAARANFGSFYLWGDVDSIGGRIVRRGDIRWGAASVKAATRGQKFNPDGTEHGQGSWFKIADSKVRGGQKNGGGSWFNVAHNTESGTGQNPDGRKVPGFNFHQYEQTGQPGGSFQSAAVKNGSDWFGSGKDFSLQRRASSGSPARKAASAQIAKIPFELARHIAQIFKPCISAQCCDTIRSDEQDIKKAVR